jgi:hypothetical protein
MAMTDEDQLDLLGVFYYILGGFGLFGLLGALVYVGIGVILIVAPGLADEPPPPDAAQGALIGGILFIVIGLVVAAMVGAVSGCTIYAGRCLRSRRNRTFVMVVAAIMCLSFPVGTALGVWTLMVLSRPEVRTLYEAQPFAELR